MKQVIVRDLAKELDLDEEIIYQQLLEVVEEEKINQQEKIFFLEESKKELYVFNPHDISYINNTQENDVSFLELANHFKITSSDLNNFLEKFVEQGIVEPAIQEYLQDVKNKPSIQVTLEPETVNPNEDIILAVEVITEFEIGEPNLEITTSPEVDILFSPSLPPQITPGRWIYRYQIRGIKHGKYPIDLTFSGLIEGNMYREKVEAPEIWIKALPPNLYIEKIPRSEQIYGTYNENVDIVFRITNRGNGDATNVVITGLDHEKIRIISGDNIGRIGVKARTDQIVSLRPTGSGSIILDNLYINYEDGDSNPFNTEIQPITLEISTLQPDLKFEFDSRQTVRSDEMFTITLRITNIGKGSALNLQMKSKIDPQSSAFNVPFEHTSGLLRPGNSIQVRYELRAPNEGEITVEVNDISYVDSEGIRLSQSISPLSINVVEDTVRTVQTSDWPFEINVKIGKYQLIDQLGEGGFAIVYLVQDTIMRTNRAMKALKAEYVDDQAMVENFINEARTVQTLASRNIVQIFDVDGYEFKGKTYPYIIMEAILGGTLRDKMIPGEPMEVVESCYVSRDICDALLTAHQKGMIHQDIKPSNIFYDENNVLWKLGDFGLAQVTKGAGIISEDGSLSYMAPERNRTYKSDVYSLGLVMREMLTGIRMGNIQELRGQSDLRESRTERLIEIIEKMTDSSPENRPDIRDVIEILDLSTIQR